MRKYLKNQILKILDELDKAHVNVINAISNDNAATAASIFENCQSTAIAVGNTIESVEGEGTGTVVALEDYCELVYNLHEQVLSGEGINATKLKKRLDKTYKDIVNKLIHDIPETKEVVFLPYKASMWDSLETVYKRAASDPNVTALVIPIPYFDRNADGSAAEMHYEGDLFPTDVPVTHFENYDFQAHHPDEIYIHNPYDEFNYVTSVHPAFYSSKLKEYTDMLVYIPYFVLEEIDLGNEDAVKGSLHFAQVPAVINADKVIVQSENMKAFYVEAMVRLLGEEARPIYEAKIEGSGSPKIDRLKGLSKSDYPIPDSWKEYLYRSDGSAKKIILYNTSVTALLNHEQAMLDKINNVFTVFSEFKDDVALLWRPHPLMSATIKSMCPDLLEPYNSLVDGYKANKIGIYDDSAELDRALVYADAYYGDPSSLVTLCKAIDMPIMIQNVDILESTDDEEE